jgi:hypothetical protein
MMAVCEKQLLAVFGFSVDNSTIGCNCCSFCKEQCSCQLCAVEFDNTLAQLKL